MHIPRSFTFAVSLCALTNLLSGAYAAPAAVPVLTLADRQDDSSLFDRHVANGDAATADGLKAKAAREYTEAWQAKPERTDIGVKAARIWLELSEYIECNKVVSVITARNGSTDDDRAAAGIAQQIQEKVKKIHDDMVQSARDSMTKAEFDRARKSLEDAIASFPNDSQSYLFQAMVNVQQDRNEDAVKSIILANKVGNLKAADLISMDYAPGIKPTKVISFWNTVDFQQFIEDCYGPGARKEVARKIESFGEVSDAQFDSDKFIEQFKLIISELSDDGNGEQIFGPAISERQSNSSPDSEYFMNDHSESQSYKVKHSLPGFAGTAEYYSRSYSEKSYHGAGTLAILNEALGGDKASGSYEWEYHGSTTYQLTYNLLDNGLMTPEEAAKKFDAIAEALKKVSNKTLRKHEENNVVEYRFNAKNPKRHFYLARSISKEGKASVSLLVEILLGDAAK